MCCVLRTCQEKQGPCPETQPCLLPPHLLTTPNTFLLVPKCPEHPWRTYLWCVRSSQRQPGTPSWQNHHRRFRAFGSVTWRQQPPEFLWQTLPGHRNPISRSLAVLRGAFDTTTHGPATAPVAPAALAPQPGLRSQTHPFPTARGTQWARGGSLGKGNVTPRAAAEHKGIRLWRFHQRQQSWRNCCRFPRMAQDAPWQR